MKTFGYTTTTSSTYSSAVPAFKNQSEQKNTFHINLHLDAASLKPVKNYIVDAINEGLKQNLLGSDINMEFLMLSVRSYSSMLMNTLAHTCNDKKR